MIDILFHVSTARGGAMLLPLARACARSRYACFFTHDGVLGLREPELCAALEGAQRAVACEESWNRHCPGIACPVELGSQTVNSALMGEAVRVVSL